MTHRTIANRIASLRLSIKNCRATNNATWEQIHQETLEQIIKNYLPSGSGFDSGTSLDFDKSNESRLVFLTGFHHMDEYGSYKWTDHTVTVRADLSGGLNITVSGRNKNDIKNYIAEIFADALDQVIEPERDRL
jgi:hypothetical protein